MIELHIDSSKGIHEFKFSGHVTEITAELQGIIAAAFFYVLDIGGGKKDAIFLASKMHNRIGNLDYWRKLALIAKKPEAKT